MAARIQAFSIVGNRGAALAEPPGNTLSSLRKGLELGAEMLRVDVRCTKDGVLILDHDAVEIVEEREVPVSQLAYDRLKALSDSADQPLATLDEAFELTMAARAGLMIDVRQAGLEGAIARAIRKSGFPLHGLLVTGADETSRKIFRGLDPRIPLGMTLDLPDVRRVNAKFLAEVDVDAVTWHHKLITPPVVEVFRRREIVVYAWTVNLAEEVRRLRNVCFVDGIITDQPDLLKSI